MYSILSLVLFTLPTSGLDLVAVPTQETQEQEAPKVIWSTGEQLWMGALKADLPPHVIRIFSIPESEFEEELARIRLVVLTSGDGVKAIEESRGLWMRVARSATPESARALTECVTLRAWVLREAGQLEAALAAAQAPFPTREEVLTLFERGHYYPSLEAGSELWTLMAEALWVDPELSAIRDSIQLVSDETASFVERCRERMGEERYRYVEDKFGLPSEEIAELVLANFRSSSGNSATLRKLGSQAVAATAFLALADPDATGFLGMHVGASNYSPSILFALDQVRALQLFTDWMEVGKATWLPRIIAALDRDQGALGSNSDWVPFPPPSHGEERIGGRPWTPAWIPFLAKLLRHEPGRDASLRYVHQFAKRDAFTPELQASLGDCIRTSDQLLASRILGAIADDSARVPSAFPVYVAGLESPFPDIRRACAWQLSSFAAVEELLPFYRDTDPEVRRAVARVLRSSEFVVRRGDLRQYRHDSDQVTLTPERVAVVQALLEDEVPAVVEEAEESIGSMIVDRSLFPVLAGSSSARARCIAVIRLRKIESLTPEERDLVKRLLRDPDPVVRICLVGSWQFRDSSIWEEILTTLTSETDPEALRELDSMLEHISQGSAAKAALLDAVSRRLTNPASPFRPLGGGESGWLRFARSSKITFEEAPFLLTLALERGYDTLVANQIDSLIQGGVSPSFFASQGNANLLRNIYNYARKVERVPVAGQLRNLDTPVRRAVYTWCDGGPRSGGQDTHRLRQALVDWVKLSARGPDDEAVLQAIEAGDTDHSWVRKILSMWKGETPERVELRSRIFRDETMPVRLRLAAGTGIDALSRPDGERHLDSLLEAAVREDPYALGQLMRTSPRGNEYLVRVINEGLLAGETLFDFVDTGFDPTVGKAGTDAAAIAILDRYLETPGEELGVVTGALDYLGEGMLVYEHPGYVLAAARDPRYVGTAIYVMEQRRLPEFVEPLCGVFRRDWPALTAQNVEAVRCHAAEALSEYGGRESIEFLSSILFEVEGDVRGSVVEALETLQRYEELRATWRTSPLPERDEALVELVSMLGSDQPPIRAAAARGLAAFGALEAIPRLIRLLEDEDEGVRAAAEKALERLYELPVKGETNEDEEEKDGGGTVPRQNPTTTSNGSARPSRSR